MNLLDFAVTPLWLVWETVREVAAEDGVDLAESELIGLAPLASLLAVADRAQAPAEDAIEDRLAEAAKYLRLRDFSPMQALELRLAAAQSAAPGGPGSVVPRPAGSGPVVPRPAGSGRAGPDDGTAT